MKKLLVLSILIISSSVTWGQVVITAPVQQVALTFTNPEYITMSLSTNALTLTQTAPASFTIALTYQFAQARNLSGVSYFTNQQALTNGLGGVIGAVNVLEYNQFSTTQMSCNQPSPTAFSDLGLTGAWFCQRWANTNVPAGNGTFSATEYLQINPGSYPAGTFTGVLNVVAGAA